MVRATVRSAERTGSRQRTGGRGVSTRCWRRCGPGWPSSRRWWRPNKARAMRAWRRCYARSPTPAAPVAGAGCLWARAVSAG